MSEFYQILGSGNCFKTKKTVLRQQTLVRER